MHHSCTEGQRLSYRLMLAQLAAQLGDVNLNESMNDVLAPSSREDVEVALADLQEWPSFEVLVG
jgi:hypothetical protein